MYDQNNYPNDYQNHNNTSARTTDEGGTQNYQNSVQNPYTSHTSYQSSAGNYQQNSTGSYQPNSTGNYQQNGAGNYHYGNTYPNDYTQRNQKKPKEKKLHSGSGYFKKALMAVSLGLLFGLFAGLGLFIVESATGTSDRADAQAVESSAAVQTGEADTSDEASAEDNLEEAEQQALNGIQQTETVTAVVSDVSEVAEKVMPSIVAINNHYTEKMSYFGQSFTSEEEASGSGIIVGQNDKELLIATNYHVINGADKLTVQFVEDSEAEASVKGSDPDMDLAVIAVLLDNIDQDTLDQIAVATLGDSDTLSVGEPAIAIGNSLGYGQSVTIGVISALNRNINLSDGSEGTFIQTDAAINPGNSGGALLNVKGEVIGINSNKIGGSAIEGMGYAIPISAASPIIADLMLKETKNKVAEEERGYLGISGISVTSDVSEAYGMPEGVYIAQVYKGTAAEAAGLQKGDIITAFDGDKITSMDTLQRELEFYAKGQTVDITIMTVGEGGYREKTVQLTLGNKVQ